MTATQIRKLKPGDLLKIRNGYIDAGMAVPFSGRTTRNHRGNWFIEVTYGHQKELWPASKLTIE